MNHNISPTIIKNIAISNVWLWLSVFVSILVTITSSLGIFFEKTYFRETEAWAVQAIGLDYANLAVVILLLVSTYYVSKNLLRAYLVWLGAYIYLIYAFTIYAFSVHFNFLFFYIYFNFRRVVLHSCWWIDCGRYNKSVNIGLIMLLSVYFLYLFLREVKEHV